MKNIITIPDAVAAKLREHFFQNEKEQGAFLFARAAPCGDDLNLLIEDCYLVPARGWEVQMEVYLEMKDSERGKIMKLARDKNLCAIDCHSHPDSGADVWFSPSDIAGISDFAKYARWKLNGKPFAAMVWGEESLDAVLWSGDFAEAQRVHEVQFVGTQKQIHLPRGSWFQAPKGANRFQYYEE